MSVRNRSSYAASASTTKKFLLLTVLNIFAIITCECNANLHELEAVKQMLLPAGKKELTINNTASVVESTTWQNEGRNNFLVGIAATGLQHENHTKCGQELLAFLRAVANKEMWSLKVLDSFGHAPQSFGWGNYFWFAARDLCHDLNTPYSITFSQQHQYVSSFNVSSPFEMRYTMVYLKFETAHYIDMKLPFETFIHLGLCLPRSCSSNALLHYSNLYFQSNTFITQRNFNMKLEAVDIRTPAFSWNFFKKTGSIVYGVIFFLVISLIIIAELIHRSRKNLKLQQQMHNKPAHLNSPLATATTINTNITIQQNVAAPAIESLQTEKFVLCFQLRENYERTVKMENSKNFLTMIAGLRTIICLWVTVFHVYYYSLFAMKNVPMIFAKLENFALQPVIQACFYVDVFFVISAFLLVYHFLTNNSQQRDIKCNGFLENLKLFGKIIGQRYMRLTPIMAVIMLLSNVVYDFLNMYSPFRLGVHSGIYCKNNWWYNLLYVHNLLDMNDICCSWTWYLGCEMQFFILFNLILFIHAKNANVGKIVFATLTLGFVAIGWLCNYQNDITFQIDVIHSTLNQLYVKPWVRINPYISGAISGWLLYYIRQRQQQGQKQQQQKQKQEQQKQQQQQPHNNSVELRVMWRVAFWLFCSILYVVTNFMSYWRSTPSWLVSIVMSFGKLCFALCIGGVIIMCALGYGGPFNALLSARIFLFLNKFCFSIYMIAPVIVIAIFGLRNEAINFTEVGSSMDFVGVIMLSVVSAFLLVLLVEMPMQRIAKVLFSRNNK